MFLSIFPLTVHDVVTKNLLIWCIKKPPVFTEGLFLHFVQFLVNHVSQLKQVAAVSVMTNVINCLRELFGGAYYEGLRTAFF